MGDAGVSILEPVTKTHNMTFSRENYNIILLAWERVRTQEGCQNVSVAMLMHLSSKPHPIAGIPNDTSSIKLYVSIQ